MKQLQGGEKWVQHKERKKTKKKGRKVRKQNKTKEVHADRLFMNQISKQGGGGTESKLGSKTQKEKSSLMNYKTSR